MATETARSKARLGARSEARSKAREADEDVGVTVEEQRTDEPAAAAGAPLAEELPWDIDDVVRDLEGQGEGYYFLIYRKLHDGIQTGGGRLLRMSPVIGRLLLTADTLTDVRSALLSLGQRYRWGAGSYLLELRKTGKVGPIKTIEVAMEPPPLDDAPTASSTTAAAPARPSLREAIEIVQNDLQGLGIRLFNNNGSEGSTPKELVTAISGAMEKGAEVASKNPGGKAGAADEPDRVVKLITSLKDMFAPRTSVLEQAIAAKINKELEGVVSGERSSPLGGMKEIIALVSGLKELGLKIGGSGGRVAESGGALEKALEVLPDVVDKLGLSRWAEYANLRLKLQYGLVPGQIQPTQPAPAPGRVALPATVTQLVRQTMVAAQRQDDAFFPALATGINAQIAGGSDFLAGVIAGQVDNEQAFTLIAGVGLADVNQPRVRDYLSRFLSWLRADGWSKGETAARGPSDAAARDGAAAAPTMARIEGRCTRPGCGAVYTFEDEDHLREEGTCDAQLGDGTVCSGMIAAVRTMNGRDGAA